MAAGVTGQYKGSRFARLARRPARAHADTIDPRRRALATLIGQLPLRVMLVDREMRVLAASQSSGATLVREAADYIGRCVYDIDPEYFEPFRPVCERCLQGETYVANRVPARLNDGRPIWLRTQISPWRDSRGEIAGLISVSVDLTEEFQALEASERAQERLNIAVQIADLHVWEVDYSNNGQVITTAGASDTFFDGSYTMADMVADPTLSIHPDDRVGLYEPWLKAVVADEPFRAEYRINRRDGKEVWAATTIKLAKDAAGQPLRMIGAIQNITERKRTEAALLQAKEDAEAANRAKSAFLATMSHEIRTPMNGVLGMAQAMAGDALAPVQRERLEVIRESGETLLAVLNDILDLSKIEAGKLELELVDFDLTPLIRTVHNAFAGAAATKGLTFALTIDDAARGRYRGDFGRIRQILYNFVSNAVKFTEAGEIRFDVTRDGEALVFAVEDSGIGIPEDRLSRLFNKFEQADASTTRRFGGTGLGLAICRDLTALMGGQIEVESEEGAGSRFQLRLDLPRVGDEAPGDDAEAADGAALQEGAALRVLAAEDNSVNRMVLRTLLQQIGLDPMIVGNGAEALAAWREHPWDVILMDVQMPVMDGPTATRRIRAEEATGGRARTPIVALTANAMAHQVEEYAAAGMDGLIAKPIRIEELFATLQTVLDADVAEGDAEAAA